MVVERCSKMDIEMRGGKEAYPNKVACEEVEVLKEEDKVEVISCLTCGQCSTLDPQR